VPSLYFASIGGKIFEDSAAITGETEKPGNRAE
jgi:hypothetical protein